MVGSPESDLPSAARPKIAASTGLDGLSNYTKKAWICQSKPDDVSGITLIRAGLFMCAAWHREAGANL
jgi:hypothetical protein